MPAHDAFSTEELLALLSDRSVPIVSIVREMEAANVRPFDESALDWARETLADFSPNRAVDFDGLPSELREILLDRAVAHRSSDFILALCTSSEKTVVKEAKRALHRLRAAGLKVEPVRPLATPPKPTDTAPEEEFSAYVSAIDGISGERIVFLPCSVPGGIDVAQVILSDETGISSAQLTPIDRRAYRRFTERIAETTSLLIAPVPRRYARALIAQALDRNAIARRPVPAGFNDVAFAIGAAPPPQPSPGRTLPRATGAPTDEAAAEALLASPPFASWSINPGILDESAPEGSRHTASEDLIRAWWSEARRMRWAERLFDMAWLLNESSQPDLRDAALASACLLESDVQIDEVGFAWALFLRSPTPSD